MPTLADLGKRFSAKLVGDGSVVIERVADLESATSACISFYLDAKFQTLLQNTNAAAVILHEKHLQVCPKPALVADNPHALFARIADFLHPDEDLQRPAGIHPTASLGENVEIDPSAIVGAHVTIEAHAQIEAHTYIGPGCVIGRRARIAANTKLVANVTIAADCVVGERVIIHPAAVIGSDGFGLARDSGKWRKIPQLGAVRIGDDVEIGACVAIDRGALRDTIIENGVKLDNQIHVAHNVIIGENTAMAAQSGIAGSTKIGKDCAIGGAVGILGHLEIADKCRVNAFSTVASSIKETGSYSSGMPLQETSRWRRNYVRLKQLDEMAKRIAILEKRLSDLEKD